LALGISPVFCKMGTIQKMSKCQITNIKHEGGSISHLTNALKGWDIPPPVLVILKDEVVIFLHITEDH